MDRQRLQDAIMFATLPHAAVDGWVDRALAAGAESAGYRPETGLRLFPGGMLEVIRHWSAWSDRQMIERLEQTDLVSMRLRDRIALAVRLRIEINGVHREALRRALARLALPQNTALAARMTYATVDAIWYAVGDASTDFSFYTKRATLAWVFSATVFYWLTDDSDEAADTRQFLERRIDGVMQIPRLRGRVQETLDKLAARLAPFGYRRAESGESG